MHNNDNNTSNEPVDTTNNSDVEAEDTSVPDQVYSIDELLNITEADYPEFTDTTHTGMKPLHHWMKHLPEDVRKHVANFRADYTRKTQELANERKSIQALREELMATKEGTLNNPYLKEMSQYATDQEHDIWSEQGMQAEIKRQAALMLQEMMKPAQDKILLERRQMALETFKTQNPELMSDEYRIPVAQMLMQRPELKLEDAFYIVKAKVESQKLAREKEALSAQKTARREVLNKTSTGKSTTPTGTPKFKDAWDAYQYHKAMKGK
jgi:hypothetical protein